MKICAHEGRRTTENRIAEKIIKRLRRDQVQPTAAAFLICWGVYMYGHIHHSLLLTPRELQLDLTWVDLEPSGCPAAVCSPLCLESDQESHDLIESGADQWTSVFFFFLHKLYQFSLVFTFFCADINDKSTDSNSRETQTQLERVSLDDWFPWRQASIGCKTQLVSNGQLCFPQSTIRWLS